MAVVGRNTQDNKTNFVGPVAPKGVPTLKTGGTVADNINARLASSGIELSNTGAISASTAWIESAVASHASELATIFAKMGININNKKDLATKLLDFPEVTTAADYDSGAAILAGMIIPGLAGGGPSVTQTITQYDDKYLQGVGNSIAQDFLGRNLSTDELNKIMPKLKDIVNKGTTTTSKKVGGKNVVTTTPGFSQNAAQDIVQTELRLGASQDLQTKQYIDFADFISKNMAGM